MKIITYNVNGIRAALTKGFHNWLKASNADVVCLQEVKAELSQIDKSIFEDLGYEVYWMPAVKKGYSGVAILSKVSPSNVQYGCGIQQYDDEGRVLRVDFNQFSIMSVYMPSGSSGDERQAFKMKWLDDFYGYIQDLNRENPNLIISGDYNICHKPIDIHNPVSNKNSSGFLPEEREWMSKFTSSGFIDTFRHFDNRPHQYTWWSYRAGARKKNLGWRIDYHMASNSMAGLLKKSTILPEAHHSDHCPVLLELT
jgi:exodeoxyribonuclease III